jgi:hypothetical protein
VKEAHLWDMADQKLNKKIARELKSQSRIFIWSNWKKNCVALKTQIVLGFKVTRIEAKIYLGKTC